MPTQFKVSWKDLFAAGPGNFVYACCCPACATADIKVASGGDPGAWPFYMCCLSLGYSRYQYRNENDIEGTWKEDCMVTGLQACCKCPFAQIQMIEALGDKFRIANINGGTTA